MLEQLPSRRMIRFGVFEVDLAAGELRKSGVKIKLQDQPFRVLTALLARPGEVVTREELREKLWRDGTFVDFDRGVNTAINKIRDALGDSADTPRFVETLPRRGYRFVAPVDGAVPPAAGAVSIAARPAASAQQETSSGPRRSERLLQIGWAVTAVLLVAAAGIILAMWRSWPDQAGKADFAKFAFTPGGDVSNPVISPNGRYVAYVRGISPQSKLWVQGLRGEKPREIDGTEGIDDFFCNLVWSPDSDFIAFATRGAGEIQVKKVPVEGGEVVVLSQLSDFSGRVQGGAWSPDGESIVFVFGENNWSVLHEVPARGGPPKRLIEHEGQQALAFPFLLPLKDGRRVAVFRAGYREPRLMLRNLETGDEAFLVEGSRPVYSPSGHIIYQASDGSRSLWALPFSIDSLRPTGESFLITPNGMFPSVAANGTLVYLDPTSRVGYQLVWRDRSGKKLGVIGQPQERIGHASLSPDGRRVAVSGMENGQPDVWLHDVERRIKTRVTFKRGGRPIWSPSGDQLTFMTGRRHNLDIFRAFADGSGEATPLLATPEAEHSTDWSPNGEYLMYYRQGEETGSDLWYLQSKDGGNSYEPFPFLRAPFNQNQGKFSPNGRFVAYLSDETGQRELYVLPFPDGDAKERISTNGARQARWRRDGKELFYVEGDTLVAVEVTTDPNFSVGSMKKLFRSDYFPPAHSHFYDVSLDGQRFIIPEPVGDTQPVIRVVQNWFEEFRDR